MNARLILAVLQARRRYRRRQQWSPSELESFQASALDKLRRFALDRSAFYRRFHRGLDGKPLGNLPVLTKSQLILVSVLFSRTEPLIRYEMSDTVTASTEPCGCGLPFSTIKGIEGRIEDALMLPGRAGAVRIHPNVFHRTLDRVAVSEWQILEESEGIRVLLARPDASVDDARVAADIRRELTNAGALEPIVRVEHVEHVQRTATGKAPLVRARRGVAT